jgi:leucyl aminopeptidase
MIKSDIADIKNLGGRYAGAITAGAFLRAFVGDTPWAHLDIAGTAWQEENRPEMAKGPTGYGVRTLVEFILSRSQKN